MIDASERGRVDVVYRGDVDPRDVQLFFHTRDSHLILATRLDGEGTANALVESGGFVTVVAGGDLLTFGGVDVGDTLHFERWTDVREAALTSLAVQVPADTTATDYRLLTSCGERSIFGAQLQPLTISLGDCGENADLVARVMTPTGSKYVFQNDIDVRTTSSVRFDAPYVNEALATIHVTSAPASLTTLVATERLVQRTDGVTPALLTAVPLVDGAGEGRMRLPLPPDGTMLTHVYPGTGGMSRQHAITWAPASIDAYVGYARDVVRSYVTRPTYWRSSSSLEWTEETDGDLPDGVLVTLTWTDPTPHTWQLLLPRGEETSLALPVLPLPAPVEASAAVVRFDSFVIEGGFARVKAAAPLGRAMERGTWFVDSEEGRVTYQALD